MSRSSPPPLPLTTGKKRSVPPVIGPCEIAVVPERIPHAYEENTFWAEGHAVEALMRVGTGHASEQTPRGESLLANPPIGKVGERTRGQLRAIVADDLYVVHRGVDRKGARHSTRPVAPRRQVHQQTAPRASITIAYTEPGDDNLDWQSDILDAVTFISTGLFDTGLSNHAPGLAAMAVPEPMAVHHVIAAMLAAGSLAIMRPRHRR